MKKIIASFTILAFIIFSLSCTSIKQKRIETVDVKENGKITVLQMVTKSGETIIFSKKQPGRIYKESITGTAERVTGELDKAYIKEIEKDKEGKILRMIVSIPISEVELVSMKELNIGVTIMAVIGAGVMTLIIAFVASYRGT